ncbi:restriction endonuclease subunit S [Lactobacillus sp.]|uniref:restriction endonuclease subunit S n=1 Tax=Lactobacillus sp. TaxID=1591 RepID=UPI0025E90F89|nr:restriction endonuclease subunit S [Lactobacillus sp.]MCO6531263.1 restriction endonuclease subunit S [Lactobacillus sp.]
MSERKLVPHIRFKGFEDVWKKDQINNVTSTKSGGTPSVSNKEFYIGEIPFIRSSDINKTNTELKINNEAINNSSTFIVKKGNILYALYGATSGQVAISKITGAINQAVLAIFPKPFIDKYFLMYWLAKNKQKIIAKYLQGGQGNLSAKLIKKLILIFPSGAEQQKIGNLFAKLDRLLDLQQQKLDQLELLKKALLQKLFPKQGVKIPELRFKGFEDEWRKNKANKIFKSISDKHHADLAVLAASQAEGMILRDSIGIDIKYEKSSLDSYKRVMPGQFVIHLRSFQGGFAYSRYEGIISPAYTVLSFIKKEEQDSIFWKYVFLSGNFIRRLKTITYGVRDGKSISYSDFGFLFMYYPSVPEQQKIGNLLIKVDHLIEVENKKFSNLKLVKKSLLQNMFVE